MNSPHEAASESPNPHEKLLSQLRKFLLDLSDLSLAADLGGDAIAELVAESLEADFSIDSDVAMKKAIAYGNQFSAFLKSLTTKDLVSVLRELNYKELDQLSLYLPDGMIEALENTELDRVRLAFLANYLDYRSMTLKYCELAIAETGSIDIKIRKAKVLFSKVCIKNNDDPIYRELQLLLQELKDVNDPEIIEVHAKFLEKEGNFSEALAWYDKLASYKDEEYQSDAYYGISRIYRELGDQSKADHYADLARNFSDTTWTQIERIAAKIVGDIKKAEMYHMN